MDTRIFTFNVIRRDGDSHTHSIMCIGAKSPYEAGLLAVKLAYESDSPYYRMDCCNPDFSVVKRDGRVRKLTRNVECYYSEPYIKSRTSGQRFTAHIIQ